LKEEVKHYETCKCEVTENFHSIGKNVLWELFIKSALTLAVAEHSGRAVMLWTCIQEGFGPNFGRHIQIFLWFYSSPHTKCWVVL
jgi:hypothetical protein